MVHVWVAIAVAITLYSASDFENVTAIGKRFMLEFVQTLYNVCEKRKKGRRWRGIVEVRATWHQVYHGATVTWYRTVSLHIYIYIYIPLVAARVGQYTCGEKERDRKRESEREKLQRAKRELFQLIGAKWKRRIASSNRTNQQAHSSWIKSIDESW